MSTEPLASPMGKTWFALALVWLAVPTGWLWPWGLLFLMWMAASLRANVAHLFDPVSRATHPVLFFAIVVTWFAMAGFCFLYDLAFYFPSLEAMHE